MGFRPNPHHDFFPNLVTGQSDHASFKLDVRAASPSFKRPSFCSPQLVIRKPEADEISPQKKASVSTAIFPTGQAVVGLVSSKERKTVKRGSASGS
jgi:hypothetical protein